MGEAVGDSAGTIGMPAMAAGMPAAPASSDTAAVRGVLIPVAFKLTGEPNATGP